MEQVGNYGYSTGGFTIDGLSRLQNTNHDLRDSLHKAKQTWARRNDEEVEELKQEFLQSGLTMYEFCKRKNIKYNTLWYHMRSKRERNPQAKIWTKENLQYFIENYADTPNIVFAEKFGVKVATINKRAYFLGLHKSHETRLRNAEKARILTKTEENKRKQGKALKKRYEAEKRRIVFGLEQKTKLRVERNDKKAMLKANMKYKNGYFTKEKMSNILYYDENTRRSKIREARAKEMGFVIKKKES